MVEDGQWAWPLPVIAMSASDDAIQPSSWPSMASRSLSSGGHSPDPLVRNDGTTKRPGSLPAFRCRAGVGSLLVGSFRLPALDQVVVVLGDALRLFVGELALRGGVAVLLGPGVPVLRGLLFVELRSELALHPGFLQPAQDIILRLGQSVHR